MNAAIRGVGKAALNYYGMELIGFRDGFRGLAEDRRMRLDHQALLASIGVAAEKGIPLPEVVLAFADEMNSGGARRALWLAQALQHGRAWEWGPD